MYRSSGKRRKGFDENLNPNLINDNSKFWKDVKSFFSDKTPVNNNISLLEDNEIVTGPATCAETLNTFFLNSIKDLDIDRGSYTVSGKCY